MKKSGNQSLNKEEKRIKDIIPVLFKYQDDSGEDSPISTGKRLLEFYNCRHYKKARRTDAFTYNAMFSNVQTLLPNLVMSDPHIRVKPLTPQTLLRREGMYVAVNNIAQASVMEAAINHEYRRIKALKEVVKAIFDNLFWPFGVTKSGYSYSTASDEDENYILRDNVFLRRINPKDFGFHPLATTAADSPILCHRIMLSKKKAEENKNYEGAKDLTPHVPTHLKDKVKDIEDSEKLYVTLWEVHDQENDKIYTYGGDNKILLWKRNREYKHKGSDFQVLRFAWEPDEFMGIPYMLTVEDEQKAFNEILTLMINHFHMFSGRAWAEEGMVEKDDIERIIDGGQGSFVTIKNVDKVKFQSPLPMGSEYFTMLNMLFGLQDRTLGIPDFIRSSNPQRKSASESAFIKGDVDLKRQYLGQGVKEFMIDGIDNLAMLMQEFYNEPRFALAYGGLDWKHVKYTSDDIQGEYQFDYDVDSVSSSNQSQVQELINALNVIAAHPVLAPILQTLDPLKLGKAIFRKMNLNIEAFQSREIDEVTFIDPTKENLIALNPSIPEVAEFKGIIPDPKQNEHHASHMEIHMQGIMLGQSQGIDTRELDRHLAKHQQLKDQAGLNQSPSFPMPGMEGAGPNGPGPQPTPSGPVNLPGQSVTNRVRPQ
jgi:hypothetical protein